MHLCNKFHSSCISLSFRFNFDSYFPHCLCVFVAHSPHGLGMSAVGDCRTNSIMRYWWTPNRNWWAVPLHAAALCHNLYEWRLLKAGRRRRVGATCNDLERLGTYQHCLYAFVVLVLFACGRSKDGHSYSYMHNGLIHNSLPRLTLQSGVELARCFRLETNIYAFFMLLL